MGFAVVTIFVLLIVGMYIYTMQRDTKTEVENIEVNHNITLPIEVMNSQRLSYWGHFGGGGGDVKNHIKFQYKGIEYLHKTPFIPIIVKLYKEHFYLVYYDRETIPRETTYKFYKSSNNGNFEEINPSQFPKHLAIQNRFWSKSGDKPEDLAGLQPEKLVSTTTAYLWYNYLTKDEQKNYEYASIDFIKEYKEKYITNRAN